jgi:putative spermidine/putrescine transport system substrate-binding protein
VAKHVTSQATQDESGLTRNDLIRRGAAAAGLLVVPGFLTACGGAPAQPAAAGAEGGGSLTFTAWGGTTQKDMRAAWTDPYAKKAGVTIAQAGPTDYGQIKTMTESGNVQWDVVDVEGYFPRQSNKGELLEPIDYSVVPKADLFPEFAASHAVGDFAYSFVIAYDPKKNGGRHPQSWEEFFDRKKFPGKRSFYKYVYGGIIEAALLADGVSPDRLYPLDFDRAFEKLDTIKKDIVWWETGAQAQQYMSSGSVDYISVWNSRMYDIRKKGASVEMEWNQNLQTADFVVVPKGSPNKKLAMDLIAHIVSPEAQADFARRNTNAPTNRKALELVTGEAADFLSTSEEHRKVGIRIDDDFWAGAIDGVQAKWQAWLVA